MKDHDTIGATLIGSATIKASALCINNGVRDWFTFEYKNRSVGQILLETKFTPANGGAKAAGQQSGTMPLPYQQAGQISYQMVGAPVVMAPPHMIPVA